MRHNYVGRSWCARQKTRRTSDMRPSVSIVSRYSAGGSVFQLPQAQAERAELLLDLVERGLAEVLAPQELGFGAAGQLADGRDVQPLERLARADRQLEVGDRLAHQLRREVA